MKKKILIGSMLVLTLLLLMPSIPAVQHKSIEEGIKQEIQEKLDTITLDDFKDIEVLDNMKYPLLYFLVMFLLNFRMKRTDFLFDISTHGRPLNKVVDNPLIFLRGVWLYLTVIIWYYLWAIISTKLRWNWDMPLA